MTSPAILCRRCRRLRPRRPRPDSPPAPLPSAAPPRFVPPPGAAPRPFTPPPGASAPAWGGGASTPQKSVAGGMALYIGLGVAAVVLVALIFGLRPRKTVLVAAPTSYKTYTSRDSSFSCDQPAGWKMSETGMQGGSIATVSFEQGAARARVVSDAAGSLLSESLNSGNANLPPEQQKPAVEKLHEMDKPQVANDLPGYAEGPAQKAALTGGDARISEWTANSGSGGRLHGYRVTMLNKEREITVICLSPERNWAILQPAFQRMINSVTPGNG